MAPANPPMLNRAWKPDMSGRPAARSTSTPCTFMATSREPRDAPKANRARPRLQGVLAMVSSGRTMAMPKPLARMIGLVPQRALRIPVSSMAATEPSPRHNSNMPNRPSSTASRSFANGTSGAQQAMPKPATRKERRVASRVAGRSAENIESSSRERWRRTRRVRWRDRPSGRGRRLAPGRPVPRARHHARGPATRAGRRM